MHRVFDGHCDTIYRIYENGEELYKNTGHLDLSRMKEFDSYIQVFAAYVDKKEIRTSPIKYILSLIDKFHCEFEKNKDKVTFIKDIKALETVKNADGYGGILSIEGGEALEGSLDALRNFYRLGVRLITLTWNYANEICDGIGESRGGGLTDFGKEAVKLMEDLGIIIDVSHLSEKGFWDVCEITKYPFIASHSCVKSLCGHRRNLNDRQIKAMIDKNSVIGINFYPDFLDDSGKCGIDRIYEHIKYVLEMGGENILALGSDYDGVEALPEGIKGVPDTKKILDFLKNKGFDDILIEKIAYGNLYKLFYDAFSRKNL